MKYIFVGLSGAGDHSSRIGSLTLTKFGQTVELDKQLATDAILGGCPLLTPDEVKKIGLSPADFQKYPTPGSHVSAPPEFLSKRSAAWTLISEIRQSLEVSRG